MKNMKEIKLCVERIESERVSGVVKLKNDIKLLSENVQSVEDNLDIAVKKCQKNVNLYSRKGDGQIDKTWPR